LFGPLLATVLVAAVAGYVSPRGFWLWGLAAACLRSVEQVLQQTYFWYFRYPYLPSDVQGQANGPPDYSVYVVLLLVETITFLMLAVVCTVSASAGAGLRLLVRRLSGRSEPTEDEESRGGSHGLMVAGGFLLLTMVVGIVLGVA
jgi:hypothetical protein